MWKQISREGKRGKGVKKGIGKKEGNRKRGWTGRAENGGGLVVGGRERVGMGF